MERESTYAGKTEKLQQLVGAIEVNAAEVPHLEGTRQKMVVIIGRTQDVFKRQAALKASKQGLSQELRALVTEGDRLATAVRSLLKEHYGLRAEKLTEFGIQPFRGRSRKVKPEAPELPAPTVAG